MSFILKALQKLEQERAVRRNGRPDITGAILRQRKSAKPLPVWLVPAGMAFVAAVAVCRISQMDPRKKVGIVEEVPLSTR